MKIRSITVFLLLAALVALPSLASVALAQQGGFDAAAAGDFEPDIAGEPLAPLAPAVEDQGEEETAPAPAPPAPAAKKAAAPAPAPAAAAAPKKKEEPAPPAKKPAPKNEEAPSSSAALPYADLLYTLLARRATFDPRSRKLTLEGVFPIVAAVKVGKGDGRGPTSLKGEGGKGSECSALVSKTARRSSMSRFLGADFKRNGTWLNSPTALLMGTDSTRNGAEIALRLSDVQYRPSASTVVFRAEQVDPAAAAARKEGGSRGPSSSGGAAEKTPSLRSSGGVVESWAALASSSGKWLDAAKDGSKVVLQDVVLDVDAPYTRQEHQLKGFVEG